MHCIGVVLVLSAALAASARPAAPRQAAEDEAAPTACALPDLSRMHAATRSQLGDAYRELEAAEPAGRTGAPAAASDPRRGEAHGALGMLLLPPTIPTRRGAACGTPRVWLRANSAGPTISGTSISVSETWTGRSSPSSAR